MSHTAIVGFSVRVIPGLRVRASRRGLRASVGPRILRVHAGAGRSGVSSGIGPFSAYSSSGGRRRKRQATRRRSTGTSTEALERAARAQVRAARAEERAARAEERAAAQEEKARQAAALIEALDDILHLHHTDFAAASPPVAAAPVVPSLADLEAQHVKRQTVGVSHFDRQRRAAAREYGRSLAAYEHARLAQLATDRRAAQQSILNEWWTRLNCNDENAVAGALAQAFEDNEAAAAPLGVQGATASVAVLVPGPDALPEQLPATTQAGNPTLKKLTKSQRSDLYYEMVCGYVLATVKEAFAVAPALQEVATVVVREGALNAYGRHATEAILAARFTRADLVGVQWHAVDASVVVDDLGRDVAVNRRGCVLEMHALDLSRHADITAVVEAIDLSDENLGVTGPSVVEDDRTRVQEPEAAAYVPPVWAPDPTRRHELRFWDGRQWTKYVSDAGDTATDELSP